MNLDDMIRRAKSDLARYARGVRGSRQRVFRMYFWIVRMNSLGSRPQVGRSLAEVDAFVLELMRRDNPGFTPDLAQFS
jgi:hypothetical protein